MAYINPAPGSSSKIVLTIDTLAASTVTTTAGVITDIALGATAANRIEVPAIQDITVNAANDLMTWSQLDTSAKLQVATTSTNSVSMNIVVDPDTFFGTTLDAAQTATAAAQGLLGLSRNKTAIAFTLKVQENASNDKVIKGQGFITGLAPAISADSPVWVSPITITVSGEYLVKAS
jgi:hypothetical protein